MMPWPRSSELAQTRWPIFSSAILPPTATVHERLAKEPRELSRTNWPPSEAVSLHRLKSNYANRAFPNLYQTALGEHLCRLFSLIIVRTRQDVPIENVSFGCEDKHPLLFRGSMIKSPAQQP
jgi:hypothetical protein